MTLNKWNPGSSTLPLQGDVSNLLSRFFTDMPMHFYDRDELRPRADVEEHEGHYAIYAEVPGMKKSDISITFQDDTLTISGERQAPENADSATYRHMERRYGKFARSFRLPNPVKADGIAATVTDGLLTVTVPKAEEAKPRQIQIA